MPAAAPIWQTAPGTVDDDLLEALVDPASYPGSADVVVHETHSSWVFVAGDRAYKVKKPVALGFLDYSTLAARRRACREEVSVNQQLAPDVYLGVVAIVRTSAGIRLSPDDAPGAIEYAVEMRSFREQDTLAGLIASGSLTGRHIDAAAGALAAFHSAAEVVSGPGALRTHSVWRRNIEELDRLGHPAEWRLDVAAAFGDAFIDAHGREMQRRAGRGLVRDVHGDLRCEHVLAAPTVRVVDRIEFDRRLRQIDVACDLAFLGMDLEAQGQRWAAERLYAAYRKAGMSPGGATLRSFYAAHWAFVRAKVALIAAAEHGQERGAGQLRAARRLWSLGERLCWRARAPLAIVICGPAASGKSVLAAELARRTEMPVVSSDAVRKRLAHIAPGARARQEHYSRSFTRMTYEQLGREAVLALRRWDGVIVDATCRSRADRVRLLGRLRRIGMTRLLVGCEVPLELAVERASLRLRDRSRVSDATPDIVEQQFERFEEPEELPRRSVLRLDTTHDLHRQIAEVARAVDRLGLRGGALDRVGPGA